MSKTAVEVISWRDAAVQLSEGYDHLGDLLAALAPFADEDLLKLSAPYGTPLIEEGRFQWEQLQEFADLEDAYGAVPVPLGLVLSKSVELFDPVPGQAHRVAPMFMVVAGAFIGLFENFASSRRQDTLSASAGGTTLMVLPQLGDTGEMSKFARAIGWNCAPALRNNLKPTAESTLAFGEFFAQVLAARNSDWRMEMVLFPRAFLEKIRRDPVAHLAFCRLALQQMSVARDRAEATAAMLRVNRRPDQSDLVAVNQIARGFRPGFAPVLGTLLDETILPATDLHDIVYHGAYGLFSNWDGPPDAEFEHRDEATPRHYFPAIFRPSLPNEPAYYFLFRPYGERAVAKNQMERTKSLVDDLRWHEARARQGLRVKEVFRADLETMIRADVARTGTEIRTEIYVGASKILQAGAVRIEMVTRLPEVR